MLLFLLYFGSNKCSLGEQKRLLSVKNLTVQKPLTGSVQLKEKTAHSVIISDYIVDVLI